MRKIFNIFLFLTLACGAVSSCLKEQAVEVKESFPSEVCFGFVRDYSGTVPVKSVITADGFESKFTSITYAAYSGGKLFGSAYYYDGEGHLDTASTSVVLEMGFTFTVYVFVNMGDMRDVLPSFESEISSVTYILSSYTGTSVSAVNTRGIPMCGKLTFKPVSDTENKTLPLKRLLSKVTANLSCDWDGARIQSVRVYQMNARLSPFGISAAGGASDILSFQEIQAGTNSGLLTAVFYVPENMQGEYSIASSADKKAGNPLLASVLDRLTYLETVVTSTGKYQGTVKYRTYLGGNEKGSFNIERNKHYLWSINYRSATVDDYSDDWKHDYDSDPLNPMTVREYSLSLSPDPKALSGLGKSFTYTTTLTTHQTRPTSSVTNSVLTNGSCTWSSSNEGVVVVANGVVQSVAAGTATITATYTPPGYDNVAVSATASVTVTDDITHYISVSGPTNANVGSPINLTALYHTVTNSVDDGGVDITTSPSAVWVRSEGSSNVSVGTHTGIVTAVSPGGTATIRVSYAGEQKEVSLTFSPVITNSLVVSGPSSADVGTPIQLTAVYKTYTDGVESGSVDVTSSATWSRISGSVNVSVGAHTGIVSASNPSHQTGPIMAVIRANYMWTDSNDLTVTFNPVLSHTLELTPSSATGDYLHPVSFTARYWTWVDGTKSSSVDVTSSAVWSVTQPLGTGCYSVSAGVVSADASVGVHSVQGSPQVSATYSGKNGSATATFTDVDGSSLEIRKASDGTSVDALSVAVGKSTQVKVYYTHIVNGYSVSGSGYVNASWSGNAPGIFGVSVSYQVCTVSGVAIGNGSLSVSYAGKATSIPVSVVGWTDEWEDPGEELEL